MIAAARAVAQTLLRQRRAGLKQGEQRLQRARVG
jgi:hypothetical protein